MARTCEEGVYALGGQLFISIGGEVLVDEGVGFSAFREPLDARHLHDGYCVSKPILGLAIGHLLDAGSVTLDDRISEIVAESFGVAIPDDVLLRHVLGHAAGLDGVDGATWRMTPPEMRNRIMAKRPPELRPAYSELMAGQILSELIKATCNDSAIDFIEETILAPLSIENDLVANPHRALEPHVLERVRVPIGGLPTSTIPLLAVRLPYLVSDVSPTFGGLVNAHGLGILFDAIGQVLDGGAVAGIPSSASLTEMFSASERAQHGGGLQRECSFGAFMMTNMRDHGCGIKIGTNSIGHTAGMANTMVLYDPDLKLTLAMMLNGLIYEYEEMEFVRRQITTAVVEALMEGES
ncbi:MAG: beta-lactamase family protein [Acidobacteria bacterium]|nr:beta-lactamase family protein [Acidobacteriota bacterium]